MVAIAQPPRVSDLPPGPPLLRTSVVAQFRFDTWGSFKFCYRQWEPPELWGVAGYDGARAGPAPALHKIGCHGCTTKWVEIPGQVMVVAQCNATVAPSIHDGCEPVRVPPEASSNPVQLIGILLLIFAFCVGFFLADSTDFLKDVGGGMTNTAKNPAKQAQFVLNPINVGKAKKGRNGNTI